MPKDDETQQTMRDAALIDDSILQSVIRAHREGILELGESILRSEPILSEFCCGRLLQIAGEMTLAGAPSAHVRSVAEQIHTLLSITGEAFRQAYVEMLKDFMPFDKPAPETSDLGPPESETNGFHDTQAGGEPPF